MVPKLIMSENHFREVNVNVDMIDDRTSHLVTSRHSSELFSHSDALLLPSQSVRSPRRFTEGDKCEDKEISHDISTGSETTSLNYRFIYAISDRDL